MDGLTDLNKVLLIGRLTHSPELRYTRTGKAVCRFNIAVNTKFGKKENTLFIDVVAFNKIAENCSKYLQKGRGIFVEGHLSMRKWEKESNVKTKFEVLAEKVTFLSHLNSDSDESQTKNNDLNSDDTTESIPF